MSNLTKKDVESFGKVLTEIGFIVEANPSLILDLLNSKCNNDKPVKEKEIISEKVMNLNLFEEFKDKKKSEIEAELVTYNKSELRYIIKSFNFGSTRLNSVEKLADFIADQLSKRTKDVFINQE